MTEEEIEKKIAEEMRDARKNEPDRAMCVLHEALDHQESRWRDCDVCNAITALIRVSGGPLL